MTMKRTKPMPADFVAVYPTLGSFRKACKRWKVSDPTIKLWAEQANVKHQGKRTDKKMVPDDFSEMVKSMTKTDLVEHYETSMGVVNRWLDETGLRARKMDFAKRFKLPVIKSLIPPPKRETKADMAVEYLRRYMPVSRCHHTGIWNANGSHYRVGHTVMTRDEMMAKSQDKQSREARRLLSANARHGLLRS